MGLVEAINPARVQIVAMLGLLLMTEGLETRLAAEVVVGAAIVNQEITEGVEDIVRAQVTTLQRQSHSVNGTADLRTIMVRVRVMAMRMRHTAIVLAAIMIKDMEVTKVRLN